MYYLKNDLFFRLLPKNSVIQMFLQPSRYSHSSLSECSPSYERCTECFRYWCGACGYGLSSYLSTCTNENCVEEAYQDEDILFESIGRSRERDQEAYEDNIKEVYYPYIDMIRSEKDYFEKMNDKIYEEMIEMEELHQKMMKELLEKNNKKE